MTTIAQIEHAGGAYSEPLPSADLFDRMEALLRDRRSAIVLATSRGFDLDRAAKESPAETRILNDKTRAEMRRAEMEIEAIEVARLIVAEADNLEMVTL